MPCRRDSAAVDWPLLYDRPCSGWGASGKDEPQPAVEELAGGIEMPGVAGGLRDHVQEDLRTFSTCQPSNRSSDHQAGFASTDVRATMASASSISRR